MSINIPNSITIICRGTFHGCSSLKEITLHDSITDILHGAFESCTSLTEIIIPDSVTSIDNAVFSNCINLTSITIPDSVTTINDNSFKNCPNVKIVCNADSYAEQWAKSHEIHYDVVVAPSMAWKTAPVLNMVKWEADGRLHLTWTGNGVATSYAVYEVFDLGAAGETGGSIIGEITILPSVTTGPTLNPDTDEYGTAVAYAAGNPNSSISVEITTRPSVTTGPAWDPGEYETVTAYGDVHFNNSAESYVTTVNGTEALLGGYDTQQHYFCIRPISGQQVGEPSNIRGIYALSKVEAPKITYIDETAPGQITLRWNGNAPKYEVLDVDTQTVVVTTAQSEAVLQSIQAGQHRYAVRAIAAGGNKACSAVRAVTVFGRAQEIRLNRTDVEIIKGQTFQLTASVLPMGTQDNQVSYASADTSVASVGSTGLITANSIGTTQITVKTVSGTQSVCNVTVLMGESYEKDGFKVVDGVLVAYSGSDENVTIPDGVIAIGKKVFKNEKTIKTVVIPNSVTIIGEDAFYECTSLTSITIPNSVTYIVEYAFSGCTSLKIYGYTGSYAQTYASNRNIPFIPITGDGGELSIEPADTVIKDANGDILMATGMTYDGRDIFEKDVVVNLISLSGKADSDCYADDSSILYARCGQITALKPGTTTIHMRPMDSQKLVDKTVRVLGGFEAREITLGVGETQRLVFAVPSGATAGKPYAVLHETQAAPASSPVSFDDSNHVTGVTGTTLLSYDVRVDFSNGLYSLSRLKVLAEPKSVSLNKTHIDLGIGETFQLKPSVRSYEMEKGYSYVSSDTSVATVDSNGKITAKKAGTAKITVRAYNGIEAVCQILVFGDGYSKKDAEHIFNTITEYHDWLLFFNDFLNGSGKDPNGVYYEGVDISEMTDGAVQRAYYDLIGGHLASELSGQAQLSRGFYLADLIMCELATEKGDIYLDAGMEIIKNTFSDTEEASSVAENIAYILGAIKVGQPEIKGQIKMNEARMLLPEYEEYFENNKYKFDNLSYFADASKIVTSVFDAVEKIIIYSSVDQAKLQRIIDSMKQWNSEELNVTRRILEAYASPDMVATVLGFYGVTACVDVSLKYLKKAIKEITVDDMLFAIPVVGPLLKGASIGKEVGVAFNNVFLNLDSIQKSAMQAQFTIAAANSYRYIFEKTYIEWYNDRYNADKFISFVNTYIVFKELVASEYDALGSVADDFDKSTLEKIKKGIAAIRNFNTSYTGSGALLKGYCKDWANYARTWMNSWLKRYGENVLGIDMKQYWKYEDE